MEKDRHGGLVWKSTEFQIGGKCRQRKWWKADGVMQVLYKYGKQKTIAIHSDWTQNLIAWSWALTFNTGRLQEEENKTEINRQGVALSEVSKKCRRRWKGIWKHRIIFEERIITRIIAITAMLSKERETRTVQIVEGCSER